MTFLQPAWLLLAAAALVPIVIHLLRRRIGARLELPTARYLARAEAEHSRELRLRNFLLMILRAAAIVLLATAAARPQVAFGPGSAAPAALAIVLDNSMSSGAVVDGAPVLEHLRETARGILARTRPGDRVWLITVDGEVSSGAPAELAIQLSEIAPAAGSGDIARAVSLAAVALGGSGLSGQLVVLTDGQATQWHSPVNVSDARVLVFVPGEAPPANRAIAEARAEPLRWTSGQGAIELAFRSTDSVLYRIVLDGRTVLRGLAEPDGRIRARLVAERAGWVIGIAESERDELPADDVRHFAAFAGEPPRVTAAGAGSYATAAVTTLVDRGRLRSGAGIQIGGADGAGGLPALLTPPLDPLRVGAANRTLERLGVPWRFGTPVQDSTTAVADPALFGGAPSPAVTLRYRLQHVAADNTARIDTLATAGGDPWMVAGANYLVLGSALDPAHTSLPLSAGFLSWLERTLAHRLTADARGVIEATPDDTVRLPSWADAVESGGVPVGGSLRLLRFPHPGVFLLTRSSDGRSIGAVVVNVPRAESDLERLTREQLAERFRDAAEATISADAGRLERAFARTRGRTDATAVALVLAALALMSEMLFRSAVRARGSRA